VLHPDASFGQAQGSTGTLQRPRIILHHIEHRFDDTAGR
jgi:hypothetical protein